MRLCELSRDVVGADIAAAVYRQNLVRFGPENSQNILDSGRGMGQEPSPGFAAITILDGMVSCVTTYISVSPISSRPACARQ